MMQPRNFLIYQAYVARWILEQTAFSVLSLLRFSPQSEVVIYTDDKEFFTQIFGEKSNFHFEDLSPEKVKQWRGQIDFVHRVKVEMLIDASQKYQGNLIYLDGDTYFKSAPEEVFQQITSEQSLMHVRENVLEQGKDPLSKKLTRFLRQHFPEIPTKTVMWNAGVLGISPQAQICLRDVLAITDKLYSAYQKHTMEQLAFSYSLQQHTQVLAAEPWIYHYWNQKDEYNQAIHEFLTRFSKVESLLAHWSEFAWPGPAQPKVRGFKKIWQKIVGKK